MPSIQIKDVPTETHAVLRARAAKAHQSLQEYLLQELIRQAERPTVEEVFARIERRSGGSFTPEDAVAAVHAGREGR